MLQGSSVTGNSDRGIHSDSDVTITDSNISGHSGFGLSAENLTLINSDVSGDDVLAGYDLTLSDTSTISNGTVTGFDVELTDSTVTNGSITGYIRVSLTDSEVTGGVVTTSVDNLYGHVTLENSIVSGDILAGEVTLTASMAGGLEARGHFEVGEGYVGGHVKHY